MTEALSVLGDLNKYLSIIALSKQALHRLKIGQSVDDLRESLATRLDDCGLTLKSSSGPTNPLHSVTCYLADERALTEQIELAELDVKALMRQIQDRVGPFYSKEEVESFKEVSSEKEIKEKVSGNDMQPIRVKTYFDPGKSVAIQVDWVHGQYRTGKDGGPFGPWKVFA